MDKTENLGVEIKTV